MSDVPSAGAWDLPHPPADALEILKDPRLAGLKYRGPGRSKAGAILAPSDPPGVGDSPYVLFREGYANASPAKVTWVNDMPGLTSLLAAGKGKGFSRITVRPHFTEERRRPARPSDVWTYTAWLVASPRFAGIVRSFAPHAIETMEIDWVFADGSKLDGYVFLDVLPLVDAYDYKRTEVAVSIGERGPYISALGYPRALRRDLPTDLVIFRDQFHRHNIFVSRELARALLAARLRDFDFEDPARQGPTEP